MVTTPVFLTEEEVSRLLLTNKYFLLLGMLEKIKALDIRSGSVQINFDNLGRIMSVDKHEHYKV